MEIIVVDNGSNDKTAEIAHSYPVAVVSARGKSLAYARQLGAEIATCRYVAYIDSDVEMPNGDLLEEMLREMQEHGWVAIHAQIVDPSSQKTYWQECEDIHIKMRFNKAGERDSIGAAVCLMRTDVVIRFKFDSDFSGASEDADFFYRLSKTGSKFGISRQVAFHYHRQRGSEFIKQRVWYGRGQYQFVKKHRLPIVLASPIVIAGYGTVMCILGRRPRRMIPYYLVWGTSLVLGIVLGFLSSTREKTHDD